MSDPFISGAICMGYLVIALFFARFWRTTRDRLFLLFSLAFALLLMERVVKESHHLASEWVPAVYLIRLTAFGLILYAVIDKNRRP
jgi:membrane-associated PAP2 superfamily phosphatase